MLVRLSNLLELLGLILLVIAAFATDWRLGLVAVSLLLLATGYVVDDEDPSPGGDE